MKKLIFPNISLSFLPLFILLSFPLTIGCISVLLFDFLFTQPDSESYINAVNILSGEASTPDRLHRLSKILVIIFPALLYRIFQIPPEMGLYMQQVFGYMACTLLSYAIARQLFPKTISTWQLAMPLVLLLCQPMAIYGLALMVDASAWAIELLAIYLILAYQKADENYTNTQQWALGALLGLGFFVKETIFIAGFFLFLQIVSAAWSWPTKIYTLMRIGLGFLVPVLLGTALTQYFLNTSMLAWWQFAHEDAEMYQLDFKNYLLQIFRSLDVFWFLVPIGIYLSFKDPDIESKKQLKILLLCGLLAFLVFPFVWSYRSDRILFMIALLFLPFAVIGSRFFNHWGLALIILGGSMNLFMTYRIYRFAESGWLSFMSITFLLLMLMAFLGNRFLKTKSPY